MTKIFVPVKFGGDFFCESARLVVNYRQKISEVNTLTIDELLKDYREVFALSDVEKGEHFERLMKNFLLTYPVWRGKISDVWRWKDFPFRDELGGKDLGIDLVAKTFDEKFWAVQCKFYAESTTVAKPAVDSFFSNATRTFDGDKTFSEFVWICTTDRYTDNAREMFKNRTPEVKIVDMETLRRAQVNWTLLNNGFVREEAINVRKLRDYQLTAVEKAREHFLTEGNTRGQLIMACGTGKTFTSLKIAETLAPDGKILFLVPSISLLRQTLEEWASFSDKPIDAVCVCSDSTAAKLDDEIVDVNLPLPAMTDDKKIADALKTFHGDGLTVIFSTYQSIDVVQRLNLTFDLVICDEAHRTASKKDSHFTKVHDEKNIHAKRRLYMTATPKLPKTNVTSNTDDEDKLSEWTMNNETTFGKEFHRISFREAIFDCDCLSDYKVFVLTVNENYLTPSLKKVINDVKSTLKTNDALKLIGSLLALSKHMDENSARLVKDDENRFMHTAVAFCSSIKNAEQLSKNFSVVQEKFFADLPDADKNSFVTVHADHVAGTMSAAERAPKLQRLKTASLEGNLCNILCNVRCLSEGVDVPALDAVIFLSSKKSKVEIVQAVGRVMRKAPHKKFGYIIIPVVVPLNKSPEEALRNSKDFDIVWEVVNALRAHDDAMNIEIERIRNKLSGETKENPSEKILIDDGGGRGQLFLEELLKWDNLKNKIYARMVEHVGNKLYWIQWAHKVSEIVERHKARITELIGVEGEHKRAFNEFIDGLRKNLNPSVSRAEAVDMLAQHLVTRPVFEALFENYSFAKSNPVSQSMQKVLDALEGDGMIKDREFFERLYKHVRESCKNMGDAASRQQIVNRLYENFFKFALEKTADKLGIVYTPVEVVDFILRSVDAVLKKHFGRNLSDKGVHIIDPFTGTGTFITRLIQSGLIRKKDLFNKYLNELHANEIVLLAYYIAAINIENAYHAALDAEGYAPFEGICFTDTFQLYEREQLLPIESFLHENSERVNEQKNARIKVIVGNPPYSVGQKSANDNNQNQAYFKLEERIENTYAKLTNATNKNSLYDSYIKAFRWASDRLSEKGGVIGFVTNAGWLDGAAMDGLRKCFAKEFSAIYIFNLRGNARTQGELRRKESGNVFGGGSRAPIAITILVKANHDGDAQIFYRDIGDYLTRDEKLLRIKNTRDVFGDDFTQIIPNEQADWVNQRGGKFDTFIPLAPEKKFDGAAKSFFMTYSLGIVTARDSWVYNFSRTVLESNMRTTIDFYNEQCERFKTTETFDMDEKKISWASSLLSFARRDIKFSFKPEKIFDGAYRPFSKQKLYFGAGFVQRRGQMDEFFPTGNEENLLICVPGIGDSKNYSAFITNKITDFQTEFNTQCFPLYWYSKPVQANLFGDNHERHDGITDWIWNRAKKLYGDGVTKADIFYYVYGFLHLPAYRKDFANELKKSLPRIILVADAKKFWALSKAGRELADIHLNYETQPPAEVQLEIRNEELGIKTTVSPFQIPNSTFQIDFGVEKLRLSKDKTTLQYNAHITIKNIPPRSFDYVVNGRSPLEWIIDRYQVKTDKASGIVNDPNAWASEHDNPRYILDLILSAITVSLKTLDIVDALPAVDFDA